MERVIGITVIIELPDCEWMVLVLHTHILKPRHFNPVEKREKILFGFHLCC